MLLLLEVFSGALIGVIMSCILIAAAESRRRHT